MENYNQYLDGYVSSQQWTYYANERGFKTINPSIKEVYELNTNWMTEDMAAYFAELVSSPESYIKINDVYYACIIEDKGYEIERQKNRNLIRKNIKVSLAVQDKVNG